MIFKSPHPDVLIPDVALSPFVLGKADRLAGKVAIVDAASGRSYTYGQIADGVRRLAAGLHARGFRKGDVLAIMSPNLPEYPIAFHGVATAGGVNTTLNPTYTADEIAFQLNDSRARLLLTIAPLVGKAQEEVERTVGEAGVVYNVALSPDEVESLSSLATTA